MAVHFIDSDSAIRDAATLNIRELGYEVACYPDGETFFNKATLAIGDCVFVDLFLQGAIRGVTILNWLRSMKRQPHVIAMSGAIQRIINLELRDLQGGYVPVLEKPFTLSAMQHQLHSAHLDYQLHETNPLPFGSTSLQDAAIPMAANDSSLGSGQIRRVNNQALWIGFPL